MDGFGSELVGVVGLDGLPSLDRLVREGASTLNARTEVESTVTLPNHTGMLTGRPVDRDAGGHGVAVNVDTGGTVHDFAGEQVASVFDVVHAAGGRTALFATKDKFAFFERSWPTAIDRFEFMLDAQTLMSVASADLLEERRAFTFIHLGPVDEVGHATGWLSPQQQEAARDVDAQVGALVEAVASDRRLARQLVLLVTADHGGVGRAHGDPGDPRNYTIPFLVWGAGVAAGADLYQLNPALADPDGSQPSYDATQGPVRGGSVANLVTDLLGLGPVPGSLMGRPQTQSGRGS